MQIKSPNKTSAADEIGVNDVYDRLRGIARDLMEGESADHTLQPTALVNESFLRISASQSPLEWRDQRQFFALVREVMRRVLIDSARRRNAVKRGGDSKKCLLRSSDVAISETPPADLRDSLARLAKEDPRKAELVRLRFFEGASHQEAAARIGIGRATADRYWAYAKVWLYADLVGDLKTT